MPFDAKQFKKSKFKHRTVDVPVPELSDFFAADEQPVWTVRSITGHEWGLVKDAMTANANRRKLVEKMLGQGAPKDQVESALKLMHIIPDGVSNDIAIRMKLLEVASVSPECDTELAVLVCERRKDVFERLTDKIADLAGQGMELGKLAASTQTPASEAV